MGKSIYIYTHMFVYVWVYIQIRGGQSERDALIRLRSEGFYFLSRFTKVS